MTELTYTDAVQRNSQRIFLIALSFTRRQADAEDVMQNVFLKLWKHRDKLTDREHVDRWLTRVTVNECRSLLRLRRDEADFDALEQYLAAPMEAESRELISLVMTLPRSQRTVIHLYYYEELSVKEIAALLHLTESAVKKRLSRGRESLRAIWKENEHE